MIRVAIVDDEPHCIESLVFHLQNLFPAISVVFTSNDPQEAFSLLPEAKPDLLFLDVEMPLMNGFELLEQFKNPVFDVIFTTAHSQYAVKAFKTKAINYLLKPIDDQELKEAILNWKENRKSSSKNTSGKLDGLLDYLKKEGILKSKIALSVSDGIEFIEVNDIMYCISQSNYTTFYLADGNKIILSKTMKEVEKMLAPYFFIRVHRSYLINTNYMKKYFHSGGGNILMQDDESIPVSNQHKKMIKGLFEAIGR